MYKTRKQVLRDYISETYASAATCAFMTAKGSNTVLQDDFSDVVYTPNSTFSRRGNGVLEIDDSSLITIDSGTYVDHAANTDIVTVAIGKVNSNTAGPIFTTGEGGSAGGILLRYLSGVSTVRFAGDTTQSGALNTTLASGSANELQGTTICLIGVLDYSDQTTGIKHVCYNMADGSVIDSNSTTHDFSTETLSPTGKVRLTGWDYLYGACHFAFPSNGLPSTWQTDMLAFAKSLIDDRA